MEIAKNRTISNYERNILTDIEKNSLLLKKHLTRKEKKLLLRIIDNKDLLTEEESISNFTIGFKSGVNFRIELRK